MRHEAKLAQKVKVPSKSGEGMVESDFTLRDHWEGLVKRKGKGWEVYQNKLDGPPFPDTLRYLQRWLYELHGRSGASMGGLAPLSYGTVADWIRLTGADPTGYEVDALMMLDAVLRHPEETKPSA